MATPAQSGVANPAQSEGVAARGRGEHLQSLPSPRHLGTEQCPSVLQCCSCIQQFMQKKELQSHLIKLHGAPKPHAVSRQTRGSHTHANTDRPEANSFLARRKGRAVPVPSSGPVSSPLVLLLLQMLPLAHRAQPARGLQAPRREAVCLRRVRPPCVQPEWLADARQGEAQVPGRRRWRAEWPAGLGRHSLT